MSKVKRPFATILSFALLMAVSLGVAASAVAAPYSPAAEIAASTSNPSEGGSLTVTGSGFDQENVGLVLHSAPYPLGTAKANADGSFSIVVTLPAGVSGLHTIIATGVTSGKVATSAITIGTVATTQSVTATKSNPSGLAYTGVAVIGLGTLGVLLLAGGGVFLVSGKRRTASV
jgi:hypothetical protein